MDYGFGFNGRIFPALCNIFDNEKSRREHDAQRQTKEKEKMVV